MLPHLGKAFQRVRGQGAQIQTDLSVNVDFCTHKAGNS